MNRSLHWRRWPWLLSPVWSLSFAAPSGAGPSSPPPNDAPPPPKASADGPSWKLKAQYAMAYAIVLVFLGLVIADPFLPDYEVPLLLYMLILVVLAFAMPGSERVATTLINAIFRRKGDQ